MLQVKKEIPPCPIVYDRKNVTVEEYRQYVRWLSENNINRTFYEPDRFVTEADRKRQLELDEYKKFVRYLRENNINREFWV